MNKLLKIGGGGMLGAGVLAEVEVTRVTIPLRYLHPHFDGFTVVHLSDLHLGTWMTADRMLAIADQVNDLQPDVIAVTGDFISGFKAFPLSELTRSLSTLRAKEKMVGVLGNHDHRRGAARVTPAIEDAGVKLLFNSSIALKRGDAALYLAGVDDIWEQQHDLDAALSGVPEGAPVVLLAHEPDYADEVAATRRVSLQLSGHTHGGQVRLPGWGAPVLPLLGKKYDMGLFHLNGMALYVNRGVGMIPPYLRFNCRPEITHITLAAAG